MPHWVSRPRLSSVLGRSSRAPHIRVGTFRAAATPAAHCSSPKSQWGVNRASIPAFLNFSTTWGIFSVSYRMPFSHKSSMSTISTTSGWICRITPMNLSFWRLASSMLKKLRLVGATPNTMCCFLIAAISSRKIPHAGRSLCSRSRRSASTSARCPSPGCPPGPRCGCT